MKLNNGEVIRNRVLGVVLTGSVIALSVFLTNNGQTSEAEAKDQEIQSFVALKDYQNVDKLVAEKNFVAAVRFAEETRVAEIKRVAEEMQKKAAEEQRIIEEQRIAEEQRIRIAEEERLANEKKQSNSLESNLPTSHFNYLEKQVEKYGLDLKKTMAVMKVESNFNSKAVSSTSDYGYFQINTVNHKRLANLLNTNQDPLNPYINIDWGTYMLADLYEYWEEQGYTGTKLDEAVLSSYNKGLAGFRKYGKATEYVKKWHTAVASL